MEIYISKVSIDRIVPTVMQLIILLIYFCSLSCSCFILCVYYTLYTLYTIQCTDRKAANSDLLNWMKLLVVHGSSSSKDILNCQPKVSIQWEHTSGNNFRNYQEREWWRIFEGRKVQKRDCFFSNLCNAFCTTIRYDTRKFVGV